MSNRLKEHIDDLKAKLRAVTFEAVLKDCTSFKRVGVWNDQVVRAETGKGYQYKTPAVFIEMNVLDNGVTLGHKITDVTYIWTIHIILHKLDAGGNQFDEVMEIFYPRDEVKAALHGKTAKHMSSSFTYHGERQDFMHEGLYHYEIDFIGVLRDLKGSPCDPDTKEYIIKNTPTSLNLDVEYVDSIDDLT